MAALSFVQTRGTGARFLFNKPSGSIRLAERSAHIDYVLHVRIDVDANRDGLIGDNEEGKRNWLWGKGRPGAVALVNIDRETEALTVTQAADSELTEILVRPTEAPLPEGCDLVLVITRDEATRLSLYGESEGALELLLGVDPGSLEDKPRFVSPPLRDMRHERRRHAERALPAGAAGGVRFHRCAVAGRSPGHERRRPLDTGRGRVRVQ